MTQPLPQRPPQPPLPLPAGRPLVRTRMFSLGLAKIEAATRLRTIALIEGEPGTGKTTTVRFHAQTTGQQVHVIEIPPDSSSKVSLRHVHRSLTGYYPPGDKHEIQDLLVRLLGQGGAVVIVDEAQHLGLAGIKQLRYLHDTCGRDAEPFTLVLSGHGVQRAVGRSRELADRIKIRHHMTPIPTAQVEDVLRQFHPRLAQADLALLLAIDDWAKGNLRRWGSLMELVDENDGATHDVQRDPLDKAAARLAFRLMGEEGPRL